MLDNEFVSLSVWQLDMLFSASSYHLKICYRWTGYFKMPLGANVLCVDDAMQ